MIRRFVIMAAVAAIFAAAGAAGDWQMLGGDPAHTGCSDSKIQLPISLQWMYRSDVEGRNRASVVSDGEKLFFCTEKVVRCLNKETGDLRWEYPSKGQLASQIWSTPLAAGGMVYVPLLSGALIAIDTETGSPVWTFNAKSAIGNSPTFYNGAVFFGSDDRKLYCVEAKGGTPVWKDGAFQAPGSVVSSPTIADELVFFVCNDLHVYALDAASGEPRWSQGLPFPAPGMSPVSAAGILFVPTTNGIVALNTRGGAARWFYKTESTTAASPAVSGDKLFFGTDKGEVICLDFFGKKLWATELDSSVKASPAISGDLVFAATIVGTIYAIDLKSGQVMWSYKPEQALTAEKKEVYFGVYAQPTISDKTVYVITQRGDLLAFSSIVEDTAPPEIEKTLPQSGKPISGQPPVKVSASVEDLGSGVDPDSIELWLDDKAVTPEFDTKTRRVTYETPKTQPVVPLADGAHTVKLSVKDYAGNTAVKTWTFTVDNTIAG
jgi:outer membrane protein assembly factor BamB